MKQAIKLILHSGPRTDKRWMVKRASPARRTCSPAAHRGGGHDPTSTYLERGPHFKYPIPTQGQEEVHLLPTVNPDCNRAAYTTHTRKPEIGVQRREDLQDSRANSVSPTTLTALMLRLQFSHQADTRQSLPTISIDKRSNSWKREFQHIETTKKSAGGFQTLPWICRSSKEDSSETVYGRASMILLWGELLLRKPNTGHKRLNQQCRGPVPSSEKTDSCSGNARQHPPDWTLKIHKFVTLYSFAR